MPASDFEFHGGYAPSVPIFIESAKLIRKQIPDLQVIVGCAKSIDFNKYKSIFPNWLILEKNNPQFSLEIADSEKSTKVTIVFLYSYGFKIWTRKPCRKSME